MSLENNKIEGLSGLVEETKYSIVVRNIIEKLNFIMNPENNIVENPSNSLAKDLKKIKALVPILFLSSLLACTDDNVNKVNAESSFNEAEPVMCSQKDLDRSTVELGEKTHKVKASYDCSNKSIKNVTFSWKNEENEENDDYNLTGFGIYMFEIYEGKLKNRTLIGHASHNSNSFNIIIDDIMLDGEVNYFSVTALYTTKSSGDFIESYNSNFIEIKR